MGKVAAGTKLVLLATIAGAVTAQMQSLVAGRDPQNMSEPQFWLQAFIRGGGGGMLGIWSIRLRRAAVTASRNM